MNDTHHNDDTATPLELALSGLLSTVLTPDERALLVAFEAITDRKVRRSLIDVACAAAGMGEVDTRAYGAEDTRVSHHMVLGGDDSTTIRRARRELLRPRTGKGPPP